MENNEKTGEKVLSVLEEELRHCDSFFISVAFITGGGLAPLLMLLKELEYRNIPGKILTTNYQYVTEPKALEKLHSLNNIALKMYMVDEESEGFHTKGYLFDQPDLFNILIGSSNWTAAALCENKEWNLFVQSEKQAPIAQDLKRAFDELFYHEKALEYPYFIDEYQIAFEINKQKLKEAEKACKAPLLRPNDMQKAFIRNWKYLLENREKRGLLISATGTGKTYACAFGLRALQAKRVLFVVHRQTIAKQAMSSFARVFGNTRTYGLFSNSHKEKDRDFIFATVQTISKPENYHQFSPNAFEYIIIDEVHRAGAKSYQFLFDYFKPIFFLGMSATPERTDGFDIYSLFDHNTIYEIRLQEALRQKILSPFHYYAITELNIDGQTINDAKDMHQFNLLVNDKRVDYIIEQAKYYGHSGNRLKGLVFCSRVEEAKELSKKFNERGFHTVALAGSDSQEIRDRAISRLEKEHGEDLLDYIFSVDVFNEGVDIPNINQVIFLRPTESSIVFVQQLGRGLRKADEKEYLVVLDFVGQYAKNYLIPVALFGDRTFNKDTLRRYLLEPNTMIAGESSVHFDEISRQKIFEALDASNFNTAKMLREEYFNLKYKLGRVPKLKDFDENEALDPMRIFDSSYGSYHKFLIKNDKKDYHVEFSKQKEDFLEFLSQKLASGKRLDEVNVLEELMENPNLVLNNENISSPNVLDYLSGEFFQGSGRDLILEKAPLEKSDHGYYLKSSFIDALLDADFQEQVKEILDFAKTRNQKNYSNLYEDTPFVLNQKYTYEDIERLLNWNQGLVPLNVGGYFYDAKTKTYPVFINYNKEENIQDTIKYEDRFVSNDKFLAITKAGREISSNDVQNAVHAKERGIIQHLFVRKNKDDKTAKEFYYLGKIKADTDPSQLRQFIMPNTKKKAVEILYHLKTPVESSLYDYLTN